MWSVGIITYIILTGRHPIYKNGDNLNEYIKKIKEPKWEFPSGFSELAKDFFLKLVKTDPVDRYTAKEALQHPWITRIPTKIPLSYGEIISYDNSKEILMSVI